MTHRYIVTLLLAFFLGFLGIDRFYNGRVLLGILKLFTGGIFAIGWIVDIILAIFGCQRDANGKYVR
ncbi:TM2 domain protein [Candidatus Malacoplasma girerdii]|uniref:TM2 domain protein n=1 Tax=Candidatus Malacoplasma girerdii TaxID=1318617 RepID=A0A097ST38_9BACT|nr:TM2 domain protein [Candidatus Malacoplasma girerdii]ASJ89272.1 MAG: TM2 domain-containing protein [Candidatus Malacoplasma girerdii]